MKRTFLVGALIIIGIACFILAIDPGYADVLYDEDNLFENLSIIVCGIALLFSLALVIIKRKERSGYGFWLFLSLILIIFIGDDISWGAEYFGFTIQKIGGIDFDGVHDVLSVGIGLIKKTRDYIGSIGITDIRSLSIMSGSAAAALTLAIFAVSVVARQKRAIYEFFTKNIRWEPFYFLFLALVLIAISVYIDDDNLTNIPHKSVVEESLELMAALSLLFASISGAREVKRVYRT